VPPHGRRGAFDALYSPGAAHRTVLAIVVSEADSASEHIGQRLRELADWDAHVDESRPDAQGGGSYYRREPPATADSGGSGTTELRTFADLHLELEGVADAFSTRPSLVVFVSRHSGDTGRLLSAHVTGNFGPAEYGGEARAFARAPPHALAVVRERLAAYAPDGYDVSLECTHHGPTAPGAPAMFVELGSDEPQWADPDGARAVARAVLDLEGVPPDRLADGTPGRVGQADGPGPGTAAADTDDDHDTDGGTAARTRHLVGFGGGHYAPRFTRVVAETDWAVGHVGADWGLDAGPPPTAAEGRAVLRRVFAATAADHALLEADRPALGEAIEDLGFRVVSETWVRETDGVPLAVVETLEAVLGRVEDGLRFGDHARTGTAAPVGGDGTDTGTADAPTAGDGVPDGDASDRPAPAPTPLPDELLAAARGIDREATRRAVEATTYGFETRESGTVAGGRAVFPDGEDGNGNGNGEAVGRDRLIDRLVAVLADGYESVERVSGETVDASVATGPTGEVVVARERRFDPERARTLGVPEGPAFGKLADGEAVEVNGRRIDPEAVTTDRVDRFPV
jgi:D-aminoacyl-tRNA deacylase